MPRIARQDLNTKFFHVMSQGINKSYIFDKDFEKKKYIKIMYEVKKECNIYLIAYTIMDNHVHLVIKCKDIKELSYYMHKVNTMYAAFYNKLHKRVGYVFRDRFKSEGIINEIHLYNCIRYVFENPLKAKICNRIEDYNYSNYKQFKQRDELFNTIENYSSFVDIEEEKENIYINVVNDFLYKNQISKQELIKNKEALKKIVNILSKKYKISVRKIEELLFVSRETIRKLLN